jgi:kynurenine formamidase
MKTVWLTILAAMLAASAAHAIDPHKVIDMTYAFGPDTLYWPTAKPFQLETVAEGRTPQGCGYSSNNYSATVFALPVKIKGGSGGPLRIFALLP